MAEGSETNGLGWSFRVVDALEKVFGDVAPRPMDTDIPADAFIGEVMSFQVAFKPPTSARPHELEDLSVSVSTGGEALQASVRSVECVGCSLPAFPGHDDGYLRDDPGLYPDLLAPMTAGLVRPQPYQWKAIWVDCVAATTAGAGDHRVSLRIAVASSGETLYRQHVALTVLPRHLPPLDIVNTHWLHVDCLADHYECEVFSDRHWTLIEKFIGKARELDANAILTPTWTPPIDTAIGGTRTRVQLIDIEWRDGAYDFDFTKLVRWIEICRKHGVEYLELPHLFTQWGAACTPAIYVRHGELLEQDFGWHVEATDGRYRELLESLIPRLNELLREHWSLERVIYHISDEPEISMLESYAAAKALVADLLTGCTVVAAPSDYEFSASGAVEVPVVATNAIEPFLRHEVRGLWAYYCVGQDRDVANRFIAQPSLRSRVIGHQLFAFDIAGFLHWGYNFYSTPGSTAVVNPFLDTCAGGGFLGGDSFVVYPGRGGEPWESIRFRVLAQAMADYRACRLASSLAGKTAVMDIIDPDGTLAFNRFSYSPNFYRSARHQINQLIMANLG
jgi:hypothetical protein